MQLPQKTPPTVASRFAVLGSPIAHSKSPALHSAAISVLGIDAEYGSQEVAESEFEHFLTSNGNEYDGLSLTMPLKHVVRPFLTTECEVSRLAGSVNTIVRTPDGWHGFNTDVWGARIAIAQTLGTHFTSATVLGGGATASSLLVALYELGISTVTIVARDEGRASSAVELAHVLGMDATYRPFGSTIQSDLLVNTLPGSVQLDAEVIDDLDAAALFDVVYDPWPSSLAREWSARGLPATSGIHMLLWQALRQARIFYGEGPDDQLPNETLVITAMRSAVGL